MLENVKLLCLQHGIAETARMTGISPSTIATWNLRKHWNIPHALQPKLRETKLTSTPPSELLRGHLLELKSRSTLALGGYLAKTAETLESAKDGLSLTRRAKDLGDLHSRLYPSEQNPNAIVNVAVVTGERVIERASSR